MTVSANGSGCDEMYRPEHVDSLFRVLSDHRRRTVLRCLDERDGWELSDLARRVAASEGTAPGSSGSGSGPGGSALHVRTAIEHQHLPKLVHAGLVGWDRETDQVWVAPSATEVSTLLEFANGYESHGRPDVEPPER
jgi:hypothetical protein